MSDTFVSHKDDLLQLLDSQIKKALTECGLDAQNFALDKHHSYAYRDPTGNLARSIKYEVEVDGDESTMTLGSGVEYAPYVELGTGKYYPGGRRTPWMFQDRNGKWWWTAGMQARPFIKPAIADHVDHYKKVIEQNLKN